MGPWTTPHTRVMVLSVEAVTVRSMGTSRPVWRLKRKECTAKKKKHSQFCSRFIIFPYCLFFPDVLHAPPMEDLFYFHSIQLFVANLPSLCGMFFLLFFFIQWKIHGNHDAFSQYKSSSQQSGGKKSFSLMVMEAEFCKVQRTLQY